MLHAKGDLLTGHFADAALTDSDSADVRSPIAHSSSPRAGTIGETDYGTSSQQWLHRDVFRRIRSRSLAKARNAIKPVSPQTYQAFLLDRQGVGPVGGERYEGIDGLMRVIEQLEGVSLAAQIWESSVFSTRVRGYHPSMLDELIASGDVIWVGEGAGDTAAKEVGNIAFYPADSPLVSETVASDTAEDDEVLTVPQAIITALQDGCRRPPNRCGSGMPRRKWTKPRAKSSFPHGAKANSRKRFGHSYGRAG